MSNQRPTQDDVWKEKLEQVNVPAHWGYIIGVLGGGFIAMLALMAILSAQP